MELGLPLTLFRRALDLLKLLFSHQTHTQTHTYQFSKRNGFYEVLFVVRWHCLFTEILKADPEVPWLNVFEKTKGLKKC